ncbi:MAG: GtrA family protein [Eubacteriales bacterium]
MKDNIKELFRYVLVGGFAFLVDAGILHLIITLFPEGRFILYIATAVGFIAGLTVNFILSLLFVFKNAKEKTENKKIRTFIIFAIIGVIGLGLTELGMHIGVDVMNIHHLITKVFVAGGVMMWNYIARKVIIFS